MTSEETKAEEQAEALRAKAEIVIGQIAPTMIDSILEVFTRLQKPFSKLSEFQQKDLIDSVSRRVRAQLNEAMPLLAKHGDEQRISVHLKDFSVKGGDINLKLDATKTIPVLTMLGSVSDSSEMHLFIADTRLVDDYSRKVETKAEPDQPDMLEQVEDEEAEPEPPNDDDLAETGELVANETAQEKETVQ